MKKKDIEFFRQLVESSGPSGYEQSVQKIFRNYVEKFADEIKTDVHGNVIAHKRGTGDLRIMLSGHADEIGLMIKYIDDNGFIRFSAIGGLDYSILPGLRVDIFHEGTVIRGIIGKKPIHLIKREDRDKPVKQEDLWIDIGASSRKEAEKKVSVGDYATFSPGMETLENNLVSTKATDNRVGVFTVAAVLKELAQEETYASIYAVSSVQEEVGLRGAKTSTFGIDPHIGIAIDVTHATDYPGINKNIEGEININKGTVITKGSNINPNVFSLLKEAGKTSGAQFQIEANPNSTGTDANAMQISRAGVAAGLLSIPNRYMHTPSEIISLNDLGHTVKLLTQFCRMVDNNMKLIP